MSARPLRDLFGVVCSMANLPRAAVRTLARGRRFSREGAAFALRAEEHVERLHQELASDTYRNGRYALFSVSDQKPPATLPPHDATATHCPQWVLYRTQRRMVV